MRKYFSNFQRTVSNFGYFDTCAKVVVGNGYDLVSERVIKGGEDSERCLLSALFELVRRWLDDVVCEGL